MKSTTYAQFPVTINQKHKGAKQQEEQILVDAVANRASLLHVFRMYSKLQGKLLAIPATRLMTSDSSFTLPISSLRQDMERKVVGRC